MLPDDFLIQTICNMPKNMFKPTNQPTSMTNIYALPFYLELGIIVHTIYSYINKLKSEELSLLILSVFGSNEFWIVLNYFLVYVVFWFHSSNINHNAHAHTLIAVYCENSRNVCRICRSVFFAQLGSRSPIIDYRPPLLAKSQGNVSTNIQCTHAHARNAHMRCGILKILFTNKYHLVRRYTWILRLHYCQCL